jgi:hypothetical protein
VPLMEFAEFDRRPILVAIAGPNGAGKTTMPPIAKWPFSITGNFVICGSRSPGGFECADDAVTTTREEVRGPVSCRRGSFRERGCKTGEKIQDSCNWAGRRADHI